MFLGTTIPRETLLSALDGAGLCEDNLYADYSGRGMYGSKCFGITHNGQGEILAFAAALGEELGTEQASDILRCACADSMGHQTITYFPEYQAAS